MINKINKQTISNNTKLLNISTPKSYMSSINKSVVWATPSLLLKLSLCNLKKSKCYLKTFYCNGLYFTMSPVVLKDGGQTSFIFKNKFKEVENDLKEKEQEEAWNNLKNCVKSIQNAKKDYISLGIEDKQKEYNERVKAEIENFILWFWSDDKERERPLKALNEYNKMGEYNELN